MVQDDQLQIDQNRLVAAWNRTLPTLLNEADQAEVTADQANPRAVRVHIRTGGRTKYSFDFICMYEDKREVRVELVDVERDDQAVDEHNETIQQLIEDYVRHLHECAQALHSLTNR